jgi:hypothetical protein
LCHCVCSKLFLLAKILFNLGTSGKCLNTLCGIRFVPVQSSHLDSMHICQTFKSAYLFRNNTQLFLYTWIFSTPRPNSQRYFLHSSYDFGNWLSGYPCEINSIIMENPTLLIR